MPPLFLILELFPPYPPQGRYGAAARQLGQTMQRLRFRRIRLVQKDYITRFLIRSMHGSGQQSFR